MAGRDDEDAGGEGSSPHGGVVELRVLGPVEVSWNGVGVDLGGMRARALVARLLIDRNLTVPVDRLLDAFWTDQDTESAEKALRTTVSRLRKRLHEAGAPKGLIETKAAGYSLRIEAEATDVHRFEQLVAEGRRELGQRHPLRAAALLKDAELLWRGAAYSEVCDQAFARSEARRLEELRLIALESRFDAELTMGRHHQIVGELEALTDANPLRERLWCQRMLALYRSGRQAEALRVYQELRSMLVSELGIEPGHDAQWLEQAILAQDPALNFQAFADSPPDARWPSPSRPPVTWSALHTYVDDGPLVGRDAEVEAERAWWDAAQRAESRLLCIAGESGIGKTRLVSELAREAERNGALVLWGRCDEDPVAPFQPFAEALERYFQTLSSDEIATMPEWCLSELARMVLRLSEHAPARPIELTDPDQDRFRFFGAVSETLHVVAQRRPVLLVLDDLHWANQPTMLLLRHVLRDRRPAPLGIAALYRDAEEAEDQPHPMRPVLADLRNDRSSVLLHLHGLEMDAVVELITRATAGATTLVDQLVDLTEGNPLFITELVRQLPFGSEVDAPGGDTDTPHAVKELVSRRVSRLPDEVIRFLQTAAVVGLEFDATVVAAATGLNPEQRMDAIDLAVESRLVVQVGGSGDRYTFPHALVRDAVFAQLPRSRRVRAHHDLGVATEALRAGALEAHVNELAHHFYMGAELADADKAVHYAYAAGERALRVHAFEEAVGHFARGLEVSERSGTEVGLATCDALLALAEAQNKLGDKDDADANFDRAAALARSRGDGERLAMAAMRAGPLSYMGIVGANGDQVRLLEEAREALPDGDSRLRAMVTARLGLVLVYEKGVPAPGVLKRALMLTADAIAMARRLGDREALGYSLNARLHALWGIEPAPERLAIGTELAHLADDTGDEALAMHGHMWRLRELLAQGDVEAVTEEIQRFDVRHRGPRDPLTTSFATNVGAMMALVNGDIVDGAVLAAQAMVDAEGYNEMSPSLYGALMAWTWWQQDVLPSMETPFSEVIDTAPADYPVARAARALLLSELGRTEEVVAELHALAALGWDTVANDQTEGVTLAFAAAACASAGDVTYAPAIYERMRPYAGTAIVIRAPGAACVGPADLYLGQLAYVTGDAKLAEVHFEAALRLARRMHARPFVAAAEVELARALRRGGREEHAERIAVLLREAEESAQQMGLARIARTAAEVSQGRR